MIATRVGERKRKAFTPEEDDRLRALVSRLGDANWRGIAAKMPRRNRRQCRERWFNYLCPTICNAPWSTLEEDLLRTKVQECGRKWRVIQAFFTGRTDINIKNHWKHMERMDEKRERCPIFEDPRQEFSPDLQNDAWTHEKPDGRPPNGSMDPDPSWFFRFDR
jgi:hypothetical protein